MVVAKLLTMQSNDQATGGLYRPRKTPGAAFCMTTVNGLNRSVIMELVVMNEWKQMKRPTMRRGYESKTPCTI
jgi:hypothetical protein